MHTTNLTHSQVTTSNVQAIETWDIRVEKNYRKTE